MNAMERLVLTVENTPREAQTVPRHRAPSDAPPQRAAKHRPEELAGAQGSTPQQDVDDGAQPSQPLNASTWPEAGSVIFEGAGLRYRPGLPLALQGLSFAVAPGQRVGVVGRSGSGKSSLFAVLLRLVADHERLAHYPPESRASTAAGAGAAVVPEDDDGDGSGLGRVLIDGVDIRDVPLALLRRRVVALPQEPALFSGTVRSNLDPSGEWAGKDEALWLALAKCSLATAVGSMPGGLDAPVSIDVFQELFCFAPLLHHLNKYLQIKR